MNTNESNAFEISTHTLTWSVTIGSVNITSLIAHFNSHAHVERDHWWKSCSFLLNISTHTLTWSVTIRYIVKTYRQTFQLTRSRGAWPLSSPKADQVFDFNSHAHVERDAYFNVSSSVLVNFNSHAHVERDALYFFVLLMILSFQLTRSRGAWLNCCFKGFSVSTFQLTRSRGAWLFFGNWISIFKPFQLTRSRGAWPGQFVQLQAMVAHFNSHAHVERDRAALRASLAFSISTHTLTWSVTIDINVGAP